MVDLTKPVEFTFILETIGVIFIVIAISILLINQKTKQLKEKP